MESAILRVSLARPRHRADGAAALVRGGARVVIGAAGAGGLGSSVVPIVPASDTLFGPRGACVALDGALWIADTGHHRLLGWSERPTRDGTPADWVIGQPDFSSEGRNARGAITAQTLNVPTGICACGEGLAVADAWNHRVLIWRRGPRASHTAPDCVLGQEGFSAGSINRGHDLPAADSLYWPYGVYFDGVALWVADTGNRRVLRWNSLPTKNGQPADAVIGQADFSNRDENAGGRVSNGGLRWPHAMVHWRGHFCVADAGNNRVMLWRNDRAEGLANADRILGQASADGVDHNRGEYWPTAASFNMPYGLAVAHEHLFVADTANSRIVRYDDPRSEAADALAAQPGFNDKGDNRWQPAARDSVCWPYAVAFDDDVCLVADSGNNRVLLWETAS
jgi:sugar lactone lactonase YvrE